ncbi:Equilibrative nucleoside transporter 3 [Halotydeus destructor]|nr:Equilibrative nucleoside transporter 3 [Halotydeus destructor]
MDIEPVIAIADNADVNVNYSINPTDESAEDTLLIGEEPRDKYRLVQLSFGLLGLATLLPWNIFITATDYWMYKFRDANSSHTDIPSANKTELQTFFTSYLSIASNVPFVFVLFLNMLFGQRIPEDIRTLVSLFSVSLIFIGTTAFIEVDTDSWQSTFFLGTMGTVVVLSLFSALLQGSITGAASVFPSRCMHAMVTGQGIAGFYAVFAQILSLVGQFGPTTSALYYFISADLALIFTFVVYLALQKSDYYIFYSKRSVNTQKLGILAGSNSSSEDVSLLSVFSSVKYHALTVMSVFWVSISVFPPLTVLVVPLHPNSNILTGKFFIPVTCFLLFNIGDFSGRIVSNNLGLPVNRPVLLFVLSALRWSLVPLIMLCNVHPRNHLPVIFASEAYYVAFITLLGLTNGYLFSNAMINGPKHVPPSRRQKAGFVLVLFLGLGVALGSLTSNLLLRLL